MRLPNRKFIERLGLKMSHKVTKAQSFTKSSSYFLSALVTLWRLPIAVIQIAWLLLFSGSVSMVSLARMPSTIDIAAFDRDRILGAANQYLKEMPVTITAATSSRSAGGSHDYFSEGDYWWPDPKNPSGPVPDATERAGSCVGCGVEAHEGPALRKARD
jgi:hypothetical protein